MKATPAQQKELLRVAEVDNRLNRLAHALKTLPQDKAIAALAPATEALRAQLVEATGATEDARTELARLQSDVEVVEQRLARDRSRLEQSSSVKDIEALEGEIASLLKRRSDLEDLELETMERVDIAERSLEAIESQRAENQAVIARLQDDRAAEEARLAKQREDAEADRMVIAQGVELELLAVYEKQRARYGIGAAALEFGVNLGSNMRLGPADMAAVRAAADDDVIIDSDSGAILVRDENSGL